MTHSDDFPPMTEINDIIAEALKQLAADDLDARRFRWWLNTSISERVELANNPDPIAVAAYIDARLKTENH